MEVCMVGRILPHFPILLYLTPLPPLYVTRAHTHTDPEQQGGRRDCALPSCGRCGRRGLFVRRRVDHPAVH